MKKNGRKARNKNIPSKHHLYVKRLRAGREDRQQTIMIPRHEHEKWHNLVIDKSPAECLIYISKFLPNPAKKRTRALAFELLKKEKGSDSTPF